jgi:hypothetical protein
MNRLVPTVARYSETSSWAFETFATQTVRVVVGKLGPVVRLSAVELGIVAEAESLESAWCRFLDQVREHPNYEWLMFDLSPTRREEIDRGLDAPEDEDWAEPVDS